MYEHPVAALVPSRVLPEKLVVADHQKDIADKKSRR
jgi:hypothetical protein